MRNRKAARRYAQALFELTSGNRERIYQQLVHFSRLLAECRELKELLESPAFRAEERRGVLGQLLKRLNLDPPLDRFLDALAANRRLELLEDVAALFQEMADREAGIVRVRVASARPLDPEQRRALQAALSQAVNGTVAVEERLDQGLLAGMKVEINHLTVDGSLKRKLESLHEQLLRAQA
jgi:F-type H+-transporting ATPase subunit delta